MHTKKSAARPAGGAGECRPWPEKFATEQPAKAMLAAVGVGLLFNLLPIGRLVGMLIDVAFALARPLLLCAGLLKLSELYRSGSVAGGTTEPKPSTKSKT
jgi:hypothetical protein